MSSFMSNLRNPFSAGGPTRTPQPQGQQPGKPQGQQQQALPASQQQQNGPANQSMNSGFPPGDPNNQTQQNQNPLDQLAEIWTGPKQTGGQPQNSGSQQVNQGQQSQGQQSQPEYSGFTRAWDDTGVRQRVGSVDFLRGVPQETMQRLSSGDMTALPDIINHAVREVFVASAQTTHGMIDRGVQTGLDRFGGGLDDRFRDYEVRRQNPSNEIMSHPAVAPVFQMLKSQVARQFPQYSPEQVSAQAQAWFDSLHGAMAGKQQQNSQSNAPKQQDWAASFADDLGMGSDDNFVPQGF